MLPLVEYMKRYIVLDLGGQDVRWYWCMFEFECVITWYTIRYGTITLYTRLLLKHITMALTYGSTLLLIECMERYIVLSLDE